MPALSTLATVYASNFTVPHPASLTVDIALCTGMMPMAACCHRIFDRMPSTLLLSWTKSRSQEAPDKGMDQANRGKGTLNAHHVEHDGCGVHTDGSTTGKNSKGQGDDHNLKHSVAFEHAEDTKSIKPDQARYVDVGSHLDGESAQDKQCKCEEQTVELANFRALVCGLTIGPCFGRNHGRAAWVNLSCCGFVGKDGILSGSNVVGGNAVFGSGLASSRFGGCLRL
jgi:hypothetical protein